MPGPAGGGAPPPGGRVAAALPRPCRLFLAVVAADLLLFTLLRAVFHLLFAPATGIVPAAALAKAFRLGAQFDLRLAVLAALPVLLLGGAGRLSPFRGERPRRSWARWLAVEHLLLLVVYLVDFGHYSYAGGRVNATVLQFLLDFATSARMVWESYPVVRGALGLAAAWFALRRLFGRLLDRAASLPPATATRRRRVLAAAAVGLAAACGIYGKPSRYPLRWSDAHFSTSGYAADLAHNPVLYLFETLRRDPAAYDLARVRAAYPLVSSWLGVGRPDPARLAFARRRPPSAAPARPPNVVVVLLESFAAYKTGTFGNPLDPTPRFDALAREGLLFTRFYTPNWGTARSVFALVTGLPDVETRQTATRNPLIVAQHTILNDLPGYARLYFLGGSLNWANIRGLLGRNVEGLHLYEEGSYRAAPVDVWGISDLDLFREAVPVLTAQREPFVAIVQTSGSHRPYTIPRESGGFVPRAVPEAVAQGNGFVSAAELEAFRFLDHGLGAFVDLARRQPWFGNTIFVLLGDHGLPGSAPHIAPAETELQLTKFHVPLLLWAPGLLGPARRIDAPASELDLLPTLASVAGVACRNGALGRDLFDPAFDASRLAFTVDSGTLPRLGLIGADRAFGMFADGTDRRLTALDGGDPRENLLAREPETAARMEALCRGISETARYLPFVNTPAKIDQQLAGTAVAPASSAASSNPR